ncbi:MAG: PqqD family protein [Planctomycetes bacterium]|nr:PqqD family protein [Planctomycetota bacterium]
MKETPPDIQRLRVLALSETGFVFDPRTGHSYNVNAVGIMMLEGLKAGLSQEEICSNVRKSFKTGDAEIEEDLSAFLRILKEHGLTDTRGADSPKESVL